MDSQRQMPFSSKWSYCKETRDWQSTYCSLSIYNSFWALTRLRILKHCCVTVWGQYESRLGLLSTVTVPQMSVSQSIARRWWDRLSMSWLRQPECPESTCHSKHFSTVLDTFQTVHNMSWSLPGIAGLDHQGSIWPSCLQMMAFLCGPFLAKETWWSVYYFATGSHGSLVKYGNRCQATVERQK